MKYDGVVIRIEKKLFLFVLNSDTYTMTDGINISDHECYKDVKGDQLMVVDVTFRDGTLELDDLDLDDFIHGDTYGENDIFIKIHDIMLFSIGKEDSIKRISLVELIEKGDLNVIAIDCIEKTKELVKNV
jgi:hypothetical protein